MLFVGAVVVDVVVLVCLSCCAVGPHGFHAIRNSSKTTMAASLVVFALVVRSTGSN